MPSEWGDDALQWAFQTKTHPNPAQEGEILGFLDVRDVIMSLLQSLPAEVREGREGWRRKKRQRCLPNTPTPTPPHRP